MISEFPTNTAAAPAFITAGPDGALWFTEVGGSKIGRVTIAGAVTELPVAQSGAFWAIVTGPDGALWFDNSLPSQIERITTTGATSAFPVPGAQLGSVHSV